MIYWELLPDGKTKFHNATQTKQEMENGLAEHLGISTDTFVRKFLKKDEHNLGLLESLASCLSLILETI